MNLTSLLLCLVTAAFTQNLVLTTGFGSSELMKVMRQRHSFPLFTAVLTVFSLLNVLIVFFVMQWCGTGVLARLMRPLMTIGSAMVLYLLATLLIPTSRGSVLNRIHRLLPAAAFNSIIIGFPLFVERQAITDLATALATALGCCIGFFVFGIILTEISHRTDHSEMPQAFRGTPSMLIAVGILAMAFYGFAPPIFLV